MNKANTVFLITSSLLCFFCKLGAGTYTSAFERAVVLQKTILPSEEKRWQHLRSRLSLAQQLAVSLYVRLYDCQTDDIFVIPPTSLPQQGERFLSWCAQLTLKPPLLLYHDTKEHSVGLAVRLWGDESVILVSRRMLQGLNDDDIAALLAHELGHIAQRHTMKRALLRSLGVVSVVGALISQKRWHGLPFALYVLGAFLGIDIWYAAQEEKEADGIATKLCGSVNQIEALRKKISTQKKFI